MPPSSARGNVRLGSCVSSAMFAAFSKPVIAKNASATPPRTTSVGLPSLSSNGCCRFASPSARTTTPTARMISRPVVSISVMTMLVHTDSVMPRKFSSESATMKTMATSVTDAPSTKDWK